MITVIAAVSASVILLLMLSLIATGILIVIFARRHKPKQDLYYYTVVYKDGQVSIIEHQNIRENPNLEATGRSDLDSALSYEVPSPLNMQQNIAYEPHNSGDATLNVQDGTAQTSDSEQPHTYYEIPRILNMKKNAAYKPTRFADASKVNSQEQLLTESYKYDYVDTIGKPN